MVVIIITYETKATARRALTFVVRIFVNDTIAIAVWTGFDTIAAVWTSFHVRTKSKLRHQADIKGTNFVKFWEQPNAL